MDAVCINQDNKEEKPLQLANMTTIYRQTSNVLLWLGAAEGVGSDIREIDKGDFKVAASHLASMGDLKDYLCEQDLRRDGDNSWDLVYPDPNSPRTPLHDVLQALFTLPVWKRVWIMQEILLAGSDAFMLWGRKIISFQSDGQVVKGAGAIPTVSRV